jgi:hypothetical protein
MSFLACFLYSLVAIAKMVPKFEGEVEVDGAWEPSYMARMIRSQLRQRAKPPGTANTFDTASCYGKQAPKTLAQHRMKPQINSFIVSSHKVRIALTTNNSWSSVSMSVTVIAQQSVRPGKRSTSQALSRNLPTHAILNEHKTIVKYSENFD